MRELSVSVVIPTYNRARLVGRSVASALASIAPGDEVIVVDDGSTDDTAALLARYAGRIRYIRTPNRGAGAARNRGIREARCPLVAFLDSDDEFMPDKLELQRAVMALRPDVVMCCSDFAVRDRLGRNRRRFLVNWHHDTRPWERILGPAQMYSSIGPLPPGRADFPVHIGDLYTEMLNALYVATFTTIVRPAAVPESARFAPEDVCVYEDWEHFARFAGCGPVAFLDCETSWNHGHDGARLTDADELERANARLLLLSRVWASDEEFMAQNGGLVRKAMASEHITRGKAFLASGRSGDARAELRQAVSSGSLDWRAAGLLLLMKVHIPFLEELCEAALRL